MKTIAIILTSICLVSCSVEQNAQATQGIAALSKQLTAVDAALKAYTVSSK